MNESDPLHPSRRYALGLVGCSKQKWTHVPRIRARSLYCSPAFLASFTLASAACERVLILSAKYGVLQPENVVEPYDQTLSEMDPFQRRDWRGKVWWQLRALGFLHCPSVLFLAGRSYRLEPASSYFPEGAVVEPLAGLGSGARMARLQAALGVRGLRLPRPTIEVPPETEESHNAERKALGVRGRKR